MQRFKDWSESWQIVTLVIACCLVFSSVLGMGLALLYNNPGIRLALPEWKIPDFMGFLPWRQQHLDVPREPSWLIRPQDIASDLTIPDGPLISFAKEFLGVPYSYAGELEYGTLDCSAFTVLVYGSLDIDLPRTTFDQVRLGAEIASIEDMRPGDMIFFANTWPNDFQTGVTHVGIYIGNYQMIHALGRLGEVAITPINDPFYVEHWHSIRRVIDDG